VYQQSQEAMTEEHPLKPLDPYAVSKLAQEQVGLCFANEGSGSVIVTRSFNHIGPRQAPVFALSGFARRIAEIEAGQAEPIIFAGNLSAKRDITDVRDTVRAYYVLMQQGVTGRIYNVCSGKTWSIKELLDHLLEKASVPITVKIKGDRLRPNDAAVLLGNPNRIRNELGWKPEISIKNTIHDLLTYWRGVIS
jgi:GDP-4-dehydro-6-deoxy-D-mannose reductase